MRSALKALCESALLRGGPAALSRRRIGGRGLVLAYHNVVADGEQGDGDASLHIPLHSFRAQLAALEERAEVVALSTLLDSTEDVGHARSRERPRVAITFDDAYRGAVTLGLPELSGRGMSATMFVSPGRLGDQTFWWDRYAAQAARRGDNGFRDAALDGFAGFDDAVSKWAASDRVFRVFDFLGTEPAVYYLKTRRKTKSWLPLLRTMPAGSMPCSSSVAVPSARAI